MITKKHNIEGPWHCFSPKTPSQASCSQRSIDLQSQLQPNISRKKCSNQCESYYYLHIHPAAGTYENEKPNVGSTQHCMANLAREHTALVSYGSWKVFHQSYLLGFLCLPSCRSHLWLLHSCRLWSGSGVLLLWGLGGLARLSRWRCLELPGQWRMIRWQI